VEISFEVADAENLPFAAGAFDVVLSTFGVMFTPEHHRAAQELLRVTRSGGRIGLANWTPEGFLGELFGVVGGFIAAPTGTRSPMLWGSESYIVELFGPHASDLRCVRRHFNFRYRSAAHWIEVFRTFYGPTHKAFGALDAARQSQLSAAIAELLGRWNVAGSDSLVVPGEYLEILITKA
jgi:SAM-dependent methyltransferase